MSPTAVVRLKTYWTVTTICALLCAQAACSVKSLDHLKRGDNRDAAGAEGPMVGSTLDGSGEDDPGSDEPPATGGVGGLDGDGGMGSIGSGTAGATGGLGGGYGGAGGGTQAGVDAAVTETGGFGEGGSSGSGTSGGMGGKSATGGTASVGGAVSTGGKAGSSGAILRDASPDTSEPKPDSATPDTPMVRKTALFVVGSTNLSNSEVAIQSRLVSKGFGVTLINDNDLDTLPTKIAQDIILISRTISSASVDRKFRTSAKPVFVWEPELYDEMGMVDGSSGSLGYTSSYTQLVINSAAGTLAAGLSGTVAVVNGGAEMTWGVPNGNAIKVASLPDKPGQWPIFAYETGVRMPGLIAPARRVGFYFSRASPTSLTANGWLLFDAAVAWLTP